MTVRVSARVSRVQPSITLAITARAQALIQRGEDVISFGAGEPDFDTPEHIKTAAAAAMSRGAVSKYPPVAGIPALREAVAAELSAVHDVPIRAENVLVSCGAKHSLFNVLMALLDDGEEVLVPTPTWSSHVELVRMAGGEPVLIPSRAEDGFRLDLDALAARIGPRTRAILLASPSNPTGAVYDEDTLRGVAELVRAQKRDDLFLLTDDLYRRLVYRPSVWRSILHVAPDLLGQTALIDGVSKSYAMMGWRIGFCAAPRPLVDAMQTLQGQVTTSAAAIAQHAALAALIGDQSSIAAMASEFDRRRGVMHRALTSLPGVRCAEPQGAFYCLPDLGAYLAPPGSTDSGLPADDVVLADLLLERVGIAAVPGSGFFAPGFMRFSYATSLDNIEEGMRRLARGLASVRDPGTF